MIVENVGVTIPTAVGGKFDLLALTANQPGSHETDSIYSVSFKHGHPFTGKGRSVTLKQGNRELSGVNTNGLEFVLQYSPQTGIAEVMKNDFTDLAEIEIQVCRENLNR